MKRRDFLTTACIAGVAAASFSSVSAQEPSKEQGYFEIRKVTVRDPEKLRKMINYTNEVMIPGLKKIGIAPFGLMVDDPKLNKSENTEVRELYYFIPYKSLDEAMTLRAKFAKESELIKKYNDFRKDSSSKNPGFETLDRTLLQFFTTCPKFEIPTQSEDRVYQMRIYRSFDSERNFAKIKMFESGSEIAIFRKCGMNPVFFGNALFGTFLPNITYMLGFDNPAAKDAAWGKFRKHPDWLKLKDDPAYADSATEIKNVFLRPCNGSQI